MRRLPLRTVLLGIAGLLVAGGLLLRVSAPEPETGEAPGGVVGIEVSAHRVERASLVPRTRLAGVLEARRSVELFVETRGRALAVGAEELDAVEKDQVLVQVDPVLARVALERARASVDRSESQLALAETTLERRRNLARQNVASAATLDDAENARRVAEAALREAHATLAEMQDALDKKEIRAPFAGVLREFPVEEGEYVNEGQRIGELLDLTRARVTVGLTDREVVDVRAGAAVEVTVEAIPGPSFEGRILRVGAAADATTKKFPVEVEIPNPERKLLPGMVARVSLDLGEAAPRTLVPRDATLEEYGLRYVFVLESANGGGPLVARRRRVELRELPFRPGEVEVTSGLEPGERIAKTGLRQLTDGAAVRILGGES